MTLSVGDVDEGGVEMKREREREKKRGGGEGGAKAVMFESLTENGGRLQLGGACRQNF